MGVCFSIVFFEKKRGKIMQKLSISSLEESCWWKIKN